MAFEFNFKGDFASRRDLHRCRVRAAFNFKIKGRFAAGFAGFNELLLGAPRSNQETLPGDAAGPSARSPAFLAANGRFRTRSLRSLRHAEPETSVRDCDTRRRRRWGAGSSRAEVGHDKHQTLGGDPSASMAPRNAGPGGKRHAACLSDRRERVRRVPPGPSIAGDPAQFAGRLRGMSDFAYFCRTKSRSHQPAKLAAKRILTFMVPAWNQIRQKKQITYSTAVPRRRPGSDR